MTHVEKLIRKEFKIKTEEKLLELISSQKDSFYEEHFLIPKEQYVKKIKQLIFKINDYGDTYAEARDMGQSGSIFESFGRGVGGVVRKNYIKSRKILVNQVRFFVS